MESFNGRLGVEARNVGDWLEPGNGGFLNPDPEILQRPSAALLRISSMGYGCHATFAIGKGCKSLCAHGFMAASPAYRRCTDNSGLTRAATLWCVQRQPQGAIEVMHVTGNAAYNFQVGLAAVGHAIKSSRVAAAFVNVGVGLCIPSFLYRLALGPVPCMQQVRDGLPHGTA